MAVGSRSRICAHRRPCTRGDDLPRLVCDRQRRPRCNSYRTAANSLLPRRGSAMVRGAANRGVALTTGGLGDKRISLTPVSKRKVVEPPPKPSKKKRPARKARPMSTCDLCASAYRTRPTAAGKRCFDCWQEEMKLVQLWSAVPRNHVCADHPTRANCSDERHHIFHRTAVQFAVRIKNGSTDVGPIVRSIRALVDAQDHEQAARKQQQDERRRAAVSARKAEKARALVEEQERTRRAEIARKEARARRLMESVRRETPIEDLHEALHKLQSRFNEP